MYILAFNVLVLSDFSDSLIQWINILSFIALAVWMVVDFILIINNKFYEIKPLKKTKKYKSIALILTILLGWTGIHKVYLKKYTDGVSMMLLLSITISLCNINVIGIEFIIGVILFLILLIWILVDFVLICINFYKVD